MYIIARIDHLHSFFRNRYTAANPEPEPPWHAVKTTFIIVIYCLLVANILNDRDRPRFPSVLRGTIGTNLLVFPFGLYSHGIVVGIILFK